MNEKIRRPAVAGSWYPDGKTALSEEIDRYLAGARNENLNVKAVIVPHAGYMFSGQTAANSFRQIAPETKKVIILGTAHRYPLKGACVMDYNYYDSPLGKVKISGDIKNLLKEKNVVSILAADREEHSIEIEIPFLQRVLKDFEILPVIVGSINPDEFSRLLEKYSDDKTVIVCSVDLSHFHGYKQATELDNYSINSILELNSDNIHSAEIDSPYAVMALIEFAKRKNWKTKLLDYKNSGDIIKDRSSVVGYAAIVFYEEENQESYFSETEVTLMEDIAKNTVELFVKEGKKYKPIEYPASFDKRLACFVTLNYKGNLKGCIGTIEPAGTLCESIVDNAISAASRDYRFSPVTERELGSLSYEVSVLSEPEFFEPVSADDLLKSIKGKGVIIKKDFRSAVFLPQVWEHFDSAEDFLTNLCLKAGLSGYEWKNYKHMKIQLFRLLN
jgi:AmmeMemoRadiSam system protein B/AmmeMemoRadiSam system protein A